MVPLSIPMILTVWPAVFNQCADRMWQAEVVSAAARGFVLEEATISIVPDAENVLGQVWLKNWISLPAEAGKIRSLLRRVEALESKEHRKRRWIPPDEMLDPLTPKAIMVGGTELADLLRRSAPTLMPRAGDLPPAAEILYFTDQLGIPCTEILEASNRPLAALPTVESAAASNPGLPQSGKTPGPPEARESSSTFVLARMLGWRASALLALKRNEEALDCIRLLSRISEAWNLHPTVMQWLVGSSIETEWLNLVGHGVKLHLWNGQDLALVAKLAEMPDLIATHRKVVAGELRFKNETIDYLEANPDYLDQQYRVMVEALQGVAASFEKSTGTKVNGISGEKSTGGGPVPHGTLAGRVARRSIRSLQTCPHPPKTTDNTRDC